MRWRPAESEFCLDFSRPHRRGRDLLLPKGEGVASPARRRERHADPVRQRWPPDREDHHGGSLSCRPKGIPMRSSVGEILIVLAVVGIPGSNLGVLDQRK